MSNSAWCCEVDEQAIDALIDRAQQTVDTWWLISWTDSEMEFTQLPKPRIPKDGSQCWRLFCETIEIRRDCEATLALFEDQEFLGIVGQTGTRCFDAQEGVMVLAGTRVTGVQAGFVDVRIPRVLGRNALNGASPVGCGWELGTRLYVLPDTGVPVMARYTSVRSRPPAKETTDE